MSRFRLFTRTSDSATYRPDMQSPSTPTSPREFETAGHNFPVHFDVEYLKSHYGILKIIGIVSSIKLLKNLSISD